MIYAIRNEAETSDKLLLRYKKLFFQSRIANKVKYERYVTKNPSARKTREKAIVRNKYRELNARTYF
jgi:hypothetical protein